MHAYYLPERVDDPATAEALHDAMAAEIAASNHSLVDEMIDEAERIDALIARWEDEQARLEDR